MKYIYILLIACCYTIVTAQTNTNDIRYRNVVLKEEGDSLVMSFDVTVPALGSKQTIIIVPEVKGLDNSRLIYGYIQLNGKNKAKTLKRTLALNKKRDWGEYPVKQQTVSGKQPETVHFEATVPYEAWMDEAFLTFHHTVLGCADKVHNFGLDPVIRVTTVPKPPVIPPVIYVEPKPVVKDRNAQGEAYLDFRTGQHIIDPGYRRNPQELKRTMDLVYKTSRDKDITIHHILVTGYASPEGSVTTNELLSQRRANSLKQYIQEMSDIPASKFIVNAVGEDWKGLRFFTEELDVPQKGKVLEIIDSYDHLDKKEQRLKALGAPYHYLLAEAFPALRRVEYRVEYTVRDYSLTESQALLESDPAKLNSYELYLLARLYEEGSDKWNEIIKLTVSLFPDEPEANINAAAVYINTGEHVKAKECLDKVKHLPEARHNLGIYEEMERQGLLNK